MVVAASDVDRFLELAARENLEATVVATVTENPRLRMHWNGNTIVDVSREFLNSNGEEKHITIQLDAPGTMPSRSLAASWRIWRLLPQT